MKRIDICKIGLAVVLSVCMVLLVFHGRLVSRSNADEESVHGGQLHEEVYFGDEEADTATGTDAVADISSAGHSNSIISGGLVYYEGEAYTRYYTVYRNGSKYKAYCGDHTRNAVRSTDNVSFGVTSDQMIRKVFGYGPDSDNAWSGFAGMSANDRQLVMALTINYIRHGQYFPAIADFLAFLTSDECSEITLNGDQTGLGMIVGEATEQVGSAELTSYRKYTVPGTMEVRKRTKIVRLVGNARNYVELAIPDNTWLHVKGKNDTDYRIYRKGSAVINGGDRFFYSTELDNVGRAGSVKGTGQRGVTVCTADSNSTSLDQQLLFGWTSPGDSIEVAVNWTDMEEYGYMWLTKNRNYDSTTGRSTHATGYNGDRYGTDNYSYAGISYLVRNAGSKAVYRFVLSYDGNCYVNKTTGGTVVIRSNEEKKVYDGELDIQYAKLPFGSYTIEEGRRLWSCNNAMGIINETDSLVTESGYIRDTAVRTVMIGAENAVRSRAKALHFDAQDEVVTGEFSMSKTDDDTHEGVAGALYYVMRKADGVSADDKRVARIRTDASGTGIVISTLYGGVGTERLTGLPIGKYEIYEKKAPSGYELNRDVAELVVTAGRTTLSVGGEVVSGQKGYKVSWRTTDKRIAGQLVLDIYKQDADTGYDSQGEAKLGGAEFTVEYYSHLYTSVDQLPQTADRRWVLETDESGICRLEKEYLSQTEKSDELYVDGKGAVILPEGTITVQETRPPEGYTLENSILRNASDGSGMEYADENIYLGRVTETDGVLHLKGGNALIVGNHVVRGDFQFCKRTGDTGKTLAGVEFLLENYDRSQSVVIHTDENGYYSSSSDHINHSVNTNGGGEMDGIWFGDGNVDDTKGALPYGTYYLTELRCDANKNKYKSAETVTFTIDSDNAVVELGDIIDEAMPKLETKAHEKETGADIVDASKCDVEIADTVMIRGLDIGHSYILDGEVMVKETETRLDQEKALNRVEFKADSVNMNVDVPFEINVSKLGGMDIVCFETLTDKAYPGEILAEHKDITAVGQTVHISERHLKISKVSAEDGALLAGAELLLLDSEKHEVERWISEKEPHIIKNIKPGRYILEEISAPAGYLRSRSVEFDVTDEQDEYVVQMTDEIARLRVHKISDQGGGPMPDIGFALYASESGEKIDEGTTDERGYLEFECISPGDYYLVETSAPYGYSPVTADGSGRIYVTVEQGLYENPPVVEVQNHFDSLFVYKTDSRDHKPLEGAIFELYAVDTADKPVSEAVSDGNGYAEFCNIPSGKYYILERTAPPGYTVSNEKISVDTAENIYDREHAVLITNDIDSMPPGDNPPDTGDSVPLAAVCIVLMAAVIFMVGIVIYRKKYPRC